MELNSEQYFPGFSYAPNELIKFIAAGSIFTIKLVSDQIIHHEVENPFEFKEWLLSHNIQDIK